VTTRLFVYGTLMPGHLRWSMLAGVSRGPAVAGWAPGTLYDTGQGWPAARFEHIAGDPWGMSTRVPGFVVELATPDAEAWRALDRMEGIGDPADPARDPYERIRVEAVVGPGQAVVAWSYHATTVGPGWEEIDEWAGRAER
jgi:gamma-glutamylcyclotransferase (GGCT)/AIG2-like uncharacterized protein YtfP